MIFISRYCYFFFMTEFKMGLPISFSCPDRFVKRGKCGNGNSNFKHYFHNICVA